MIVERIAGWSTRHRAAAIGGWFALVAVAVLASILVSGAEARTSDPGEAGRAQDALRAQRAGQPVRENVLVQSRDGTGGFADDPGLRQATEDLVSTLRQQSTAVAGVQSPLDPGGERLVSPDGRSALVTFGVAGPGAEIRAHFRTTRNAIQAVGERHPDARLMQAGDLSTTAAVDAAYDDDLRRAEIISLPLTLLILLIVFGALLAAGIPLLLAATSVLSALTLLEALGHWVPINSTASSMVLLIGMAVGIDYSLFYLRREREERAAGRDTRQALQTAARTSGRAVVISGLTVMFCLAGLFLTGMDVFTGVAIGTILVVGLAVLGSVTVLPALLALLGPRVDRVRIPWLGRRRTAAATSRFWSAVARTAARHPLLLGIAAVLVLGILALPAANMQLRDPAVTDSLPRSIPAVDAVARIQSAFPGGPSPAQVVVWGDNVDSQAVRDAVEMLRREVAAHDDEFGSTVSTTAVGAALVVRVPLAGSGTDATSYRALRTLREDVLPATLGRVDGVQTAVGGDTATAHDFADVLSGRTPWVLGFALALAVVLLVLSFRSVAIPLVSILLNLLSIGAAYGVVTWIFQGGHLASALGFTSYGGVVSWLPLFMFVVLFGLSMDYHIFILSRIRERWLGGAPAREAVVAGISSSAGVVTSAAVIMVAVFSIFVALSAIEYKMLGIGMAVAILLDATVVRGVLLPAILSLLGGAAWAFPGRSPVKPAAGVPDQAVAKV